MKYERSEKMSNRALAFFLTLALAGVTTSCSNSIENIEVSNDQVYESSNGSIIENMKNYDIKKIEIRDPHSGVYETDLSFQIDDKYIQRFSDIVTTIKTDSELPMRTALYSIAFFDDNNKIIDLWTIDVYRTIMSENNDKFLRERDSELDLLLSDLEKNYELGYQLLERIPGKLYFENIVKSDKVYICSQDDTHFDDDQSINFELSNELVNKIIDNWQAINIASSQNKNYNIQYTVNMYDESGIAISALHISDSNKIYTSTGYELSGKFICDWIEEAKMEANIK